MMGARAQVAEAIARIETLPGDGPNRWTVDVPGWAISAPTKPKLCRMLWDWFARPAHPGDMM